MGVQRNRSKWMQWGIYGLGVALAIFLWVSPPQELGPNWLQAGGAIVGALLLGTGARWVDVVEWWWGLTMKQVLGVAVRAVLVGIALIALSWGLAAPPPALSWLLPPQPGLSKLVGFIATFVSSFSIYMLWYYPLAVRNAGGWSQAGQPVDQRFTTAVVGSPVNNSTAWLIAAIAQARWNLTTSEAAVVVYVVALAPYLYIIWAQGRRGRPSEEPPLNWLDWVRAVMGLLLTMLMWELMSQLWGGNGLQQAAVDLIPHGWPTWVQTAVVSLTDPLTAVNVLTGVLGVGAGQWPGWRGLINLRWWVRRWKDVVEVVLWDSLGAPFALFAAAWIHITPAWVEDEMTNWVLQFVLNIFNLIVGLIQTRKRGEGANRTNAA